MSDWGAVLDDYIDNSAERLRQIRRHIHAHPETSGEEFQTTFYLAERLKEAGIVCRIPVSERGLTADSQDEGGLRIALRGDIDALPLHDEKEVPYRSTRDGVAHACGHDAHATMVLGAVEALQACRQALPWPVPWRAIFQPAEETTVGAREMIEAGAMDGVKSAIALHVDPETRLGRIALRQGYLTAACETLQVLIRGEGGHAARPHHTKDPIAVATQFVNAVYQFIPRAIDSREPVVVSFGMIRGGSNANVIPESVQLEGTMRTLGGETAERVKMRIQTIAEGVAEAGASHIDVRFIPGADAVFNDTGVSTICAAAARDVTGADGIATIAVPSMGSEDFSAYQAYVPVCMLRLGISSGPTSSYFLHSPRFDIDERALVIGAKVLARSAVQLAHPGALH